jgi:hypothetical protein
MHTSVDSAFYSCQRLELFWASRFQKEFSTLTMNGQEGLFAVLKLFLLSSFCEGAYARLIFFSDAKLWSLIHCYTVNFHSISPLNLN